MQNLLKLLSSNLVLQSLLIICSQRLVPQSRMNNAKDPSCRNFPNIFLSFIRLVRGAVNILKLWWLSFFPPLIIGLLLEVEFPSTTASQGHMTNKAAKRIKIRKVLIIQRGKEMIYTNLKYKRVGQRLRKIHINQHSCEVTIIPLRVISSNFSDTLTPRTRSDKI